MATKQIETSIVNVTPNMCIEWLEKNEDNRILHTKHINFLARQMVKGDWQLNGESLKFDTAGNILDGQHRMWACIESNVPFKTLITKNLSRKTFDTIDTGENRKAGDILSINGEQNVNILVAALKHIARYYSGNMLVQTKFSNREVEDLLEQHPDVRDYAAVANKYHVRWCSPSLLTTCWYLASRKNKTKADEFFKSLSLGTNLTADSVILTLRNKLIDCQASPIHRLTSLQKIELIINSWNLWRKGKTVKHFRIASLAKTSADFPSFK